MAAIGPRIAQGDDDGQRRNKVKKRRWDAVLVGAGMAIAFSIIMMKLTGYFPCDIVNVLQPSAGLNCGSSVESNFSAFFDWSRQTVESFFPVINGLFP